MPESRRILVIRTGALGDTIVMSVVYQALRAYFPSAWIEALGHVERLRLITTPGLIDRLRSLESAEFAELYLEQARLSERLTRYFHQFDTILLYSVDSENALHHALCKICAQSVHAFPPFPPVGERVHITAYLLRTLQDLGIHADGIKPEIAFPESVSHDFPNEMVIAVHPSSGSRQKNWPAEYVGDVCGWFIEHYQAHILLIRGPADADAAQAVAPRLPNQAVTLLHEPDLRKLAARLRQCRVYLGNDSGISHLAAAAGVPSVVLFGPSDPRVWRPIGPRVRVLRGNGRPYCEGIAVKDVRQALEAMLRAGLPGMHGIDSST